MVSSDDKRALVNMFQELSGHQWNRKFGWVGQEKSMTRPDIRMFACSPALFHGVQLQKLGKGALLTGIV